MTRTMMASSTLRGSIALTAPTIERALAAAGIVRAHVVRSARIDVALPAGAETEAEDAPATVTALDAATLSDAAAAIPQLPPGRAIAWALPIARPGMLGWTMARMRRLAPVPLEEACAALRHAGVVDVRITTVEGALPLVVVSGITTAA